MRTNPFRRDLAMSNKILNDDERIRFLVQMSANDAIDAIDDILSSLENGSPAIETLEAARAALEGMKQ